MILIPVCSAESVVSYLEDWTNNDEVNFAVCQDILEIVYRSLKVAVRNKARLSRVVNTASKVTGCSQIPLADVYAKAMKRKTSQIIAVSAHPLHPLIRRLPSGRRFRVPLAQKNSYKKPFIPSAIKVLNANSFRCRTYPGGREEYLL